LKHITFVLIIVFGLTLSPIKSNAAWRDNSDQLPWMDDGGGSTALIVGGAVVTGLLVYLLVKPSKKETVSLNTELNSSSQSVLRKKNSMNKVLYY
jgi:hypothetical protein